MSDTHVVPELAEIAGAILFVAKDPVTPRQILAALRRTAERHGGATQDFESAAEADVAEAIERLKVSCLQGPSGVRIVEISNGFRMENLATCGPWVREFLEKGKSQRLSQPALETLAIIAYRQPVVRAEIESVRGVAVDQIVRNLLDLQLIRIAGRSDAPGRPWLFATTQKFLEHFGLRSLEDLPGVDELRRMDAARNPESTGGSAPDAAPAEPGHEEESPGESLRAAFADDDDEAGDRPPDSPAPGS